MAEDTISLYASLEANDLQLLLSIQNRCLRTFSHHIAIRENLIRSLEKNLSAGGFSKESLLRLSELQERAERCGKQIVLEMARLRETIRGYWQKIGSPAAKAETPYLRKKPTQRRVTV